MQYNHKPLEHYRINSNAKLNRRDTRARKRSSLSDPAIDVMTDFTHTIPLSVTSTARIDVANNRMLSYGVRLLFVTNNINDLVGLITATDLLGEKPMQHITEHGGRHDEIQTQDIMTPASEIEVIYMSDVLKATVGDIVETVKEVGRQHIIVVEPIPDHDAELIRGIFSTSRIAKQLGIEIEITNQASTFAEFIKAIATY